MIPIVDEKDREERNRDKESSTSLNSNKTEAPKGLDNRPQMLFWLNYSFFFSTPHTVLQVRVSRELLVKLILEKKKRKLISDIL